MIRKLIQHGESSLAVVLPRKWIISHNLSKGNEVNVGQINEDIIIMAKSIHMQNSIFIDVSNKNYSLKKIITAAYKTGYDDIRIKFSSPIELETIKEKLLRSSRGIEIIGQTKEHLHLKKIEKDNFEEFDTILRRLFFLVNQISKETAEAIKKNDFSWMQTLPLLCLEIKRFSDYCKRALNVGFTSKYKKIGPLYLIIEEIERISHYYRIILRNSSLDKTKIDKEVIKFMQELADYEYCFYETFYNFSLEKAEELEKKYKELNKKLEKLEMKMTKKEVKIINNLRIILQKIHDLNGTLVILYL